MSSTVSTGYLCGAQQKPSGVQRFTATSVFPATVHVVATSFGDQQVSQVVPS